MTATPEEGSGPIPLAESPRIAAPEQWTALLRIVRGNEDDAREMLSGRLAGRLDAVIVNRTLNPVPELTRIRQAEHLCDQILTMLDELRNGMVLRGYTPASPHRPMDIPRELPLEYDLSNGTAQSGDLRYHGVSFVPRRSVSQSETLTLPSALPAVSDAALRKFCQEQLAERPVPSIEKLREAAKIQFSGNRVTRKRVRDLHRELVPPQLRVSGPRKKPLRTGQAANRPESAAAERQ